jgi:hypothetical protein
VLENVSAGMAQILHERYHPVAIKWVFWIIVLAEKVIKLLMRPPTKAVSDLTVSILWLTTPIWFARLVIFRMRFNSWYWWCYSTWSVFIPIKHGGITYSRELQSACVKFCDANWGVLTAFTCSNRVPISLHPDARKWWYRATKQYN